MNAVLRTVEATIDRNGLVKLREPLALQAPARALVTILDDLAEFNEAAVLGESALADWLVPAEDRAWKHLSELSALDEDER